ADDENADSKAVEKLAPGRRSPSLSPSPPLGAILSPAGPVRFERRVQCVLWLAASGPRSTRCLAPGVHVRSVSVAASGHRDDGCRVASPETSWLIGVDRYRPPMLLDIAPQLLEVLLCGVMAYETSRQLRGSIVDHRNQGRASHPSCQPVML